MPRYTLVVGNVCALHTTNGFAAYRDFQFYAGKSKRLEGRCAGERVTLFNNGEVVREYNPPQELDDMSN